MADESDVSNALVAAVTAVVYPNGTGQQSVTGTPVKVYRGWPQAASLDADLLAHKVNITISPRDGMVRNTTRWLIDDIEAPYVAPDITAAVSGATVTFAGAITPGNAVGIGIGRFGYTYQVQVGDTLASIAARYAAFFGGTSSGPAVTIPTNQTVTAASVALGSSSRDVRRTEQGFTISIWAFDYPSRDAAAAAVDTALADTPFLTMPDTSEARLRFGQTISSDHAENANLFRRDLIYMVEYSTIAVTNAARVLFAGANISRDIGAAADGQPAFIAGQVYAATPSF